MHVPQTAGDLRVDKVCRERRGTGDGTHKDRSGGDAISKLPAEERACEGNGEGAHPERGQMRK